jgi:hypothetical protein
MSRVPSTLMDFRDLVTALYDAEPASWTGDVIEPWLVARPHLIGDLRELGRPENRRVRPAVEDLWGLYAVSRVVDLLLLPHQPAGPEPEDPSYDGGAWPGPAARSAWPAFRALIGATPMGGTPFHPFFHEIVSVETAADPDEPPVVIGEHWSGAFVGGLLLVRAGVAVRAGVHHLDPVLATRSCLYWAWRRRNREVRDLSHGWGSNSQWRTEFRRDYITEGALFYNVDADPSDRPPPGELGEADRRDLLRHRCSVRTDLGNDEWPFDDTLAEPAP